MILCSKYVGEPWRVGGADTRLCHPKPLLPEGFENKDYVHMVSFSPQMLEDILVRSRS